VGKVTRNASETREGTSGQVGTLARGNKLRGRVGVWGNFLTKSIRTGLIYYGFIK